MGTAEWIAVAAVVTPVLLAIGLVIYKLGRLQSGAEGRAKGLSTGIKAVDGKVDTLTTSFDLLDKEMKQHIRDHWLFKPAPSGDDS